MALKVNGVDATAETVLKKEYPLSRPLFMYTNGRPKEGTHLYNYVNLHSTAEGRKIVDDAGFVSLRQE
jgi:phosphate transport system substrate-binding protein